MDVTDGSRFQFMPITVSGRVVETFFLRARTNVRAKGRGVNSVFLVQLRKILDASSRGFAGMKSLSKRCG